MDQLPDDFSEGGNRSRWVLRNTGQGTFEDVTDEITLPKFKPAS